jgi:hypothetical protein
MLYRPSPTPQPSHQYTPSPPEAQNGVWAEAVVRKFTLPGYLGGCEHSIHRDRPRGDPDPPSLGMEKTCRCGTSVMSGEWSRGCGLLLARGTQQRLLSETPEDRRCETCISRFGLRPPLGQLIFKDASAAPQGTYLEQDSKNTRSSPEDQPHPIG